MLKQLEKIFAFRVSETTDPVFYLQKQDEMGRFDNQRRNRLLGSIVIKLIDQEKEQNSLRDQIKLLQEQVAELTTKVSGYESDISALRESFTKLEELLTAPAPQSAPTDLPPKDSTESGANPETKNKNKSK